jgi:ATP-dependent metalloprotease FtsH
MYLFYPALFLLWPFTVFAFLHSTHTEKFVLRKITMANSGNEKNENKQYWPPQGRKQIEEYLRRLNSKNVSLQNQAILNNDTPDDLMDAFLRGSDLDITKEMYENRTTYFPKKSQKQKIFILHLPIADNKEIELKFNQESESGDESNPFLNLNNDPNADHEEDDDPYEDDVSFRSKRSKKADAKSKKSENFEVILKPEFSFKDIGGCESIKEELMQCTDLLINYKKYEKYNVRTPKGIILEGPPGNGKTLLAKGFAGETKTAFIPVSGAQFQEKYVGVGSSRIRELFKLAKNNVPCIIFIDEIDAVGRSRSSDGESATSERDNTLNELLVQLDGFGTTKGIFLMGATNRVDMLDPALIRPGRIDKKIFIGPPDSVTREAIINIHLKGKPYDSVSVNIKDLVDLTNGMSGAQIENILNEAMLNALRYNRKKIEYKDIDTVINKIMVGWQPYEHQFTTDLLERIAIHEMGHAVVGFLSKHHSKVSKVAINLSSPNSPGYTIFETSATNIYKREALFEHLMILLAGRIAEEVFYDISTTTGAFNDFQEAFKLAEKMIVYYGMGSRLIYPSLSEKYKEMIDNEITLLINDAYKTAQFLLKNSKHLIKECAVILNQDKILKIDRLTEIIQTKYPEILNLSEFSPLKN